MNPFYDGKAKAAVGAKNPDVPAQMSGEVPAAISGDHGLGTNQPMTDDHNEPMGAGAGQDVTIDNSDGKEMLYPELLQEKKSNFFDGEPIFQPAQNSEIKEVLLGKSLMKAETKDGKQLTMQQNSSPGAQFQNIVMLYDPKCKHSQAFKAEYVKFAK